jgi:hypothetical protein
MTDVTQILSEMAHGDPAAADRLLQLVYDELRRLAAAKLGQREARPNSAGYGIGA